MRCLVLPGEDCMAWHEQLTGTMEPFHTKAPFFIQWALEKDPSHWNFCFNPLPFCKTFSSVGQCGKPWYENTLDLTLHRENSAGKEWTADKNTDAKAFAFQCAIKSDPSYFSALTSCAVRMECALTNALCLGEGKAWSQQQRGRLFVAGIDDCRVRGSWATQSHKSWSKHHVNEYDTWL